MPEITIVFNTAGEVQVEANGFKGKGCGAATKFVKDALGEVTSETKKLEWFEENLERTGKVNTNLCG